MNQYYPDRINNHKRFYTRRKKLRNNSTPEETLLWRILKNSNIGFKFRRQHSVGNYILDFYCPKKKLAIELDGNHHFNQKEYDMTRDAYLVSYGIQVLRFSNTQFLKKTRRTIDIILYYLNKS